MTRLDRYQSARTRLRLQSEQRQQITARKRIEKQIDECERKGR